MMDRWFWFTCWFFAEIICFNRGDITVGLPEVKLKVLAEFPWISVTHFIKSSQSSFIDFCPSSFIAVVDWEFCGESGLYPELGILPFLSKCLKFPNISRYKLENITLKLFFCQIDIELNCSMQPSKRSIRLKVVQVRVAVDICLVIAAIYYGIKHSLLASKLLREN